MYWGAFPVVSKHISVRSVCLWNHTMCLRCLTLTCRLTWDFFYGNSSWHQTFYKAYALYTGAVVMEISWQFGAYRGFANIKSTRNMSRSYWKCSPAHKYRLHKSKWTFSGKYQKVGITFFPRWANGLPGVNGLPSHKVIMNITPPRIAVTMILISISMHVGDWF